jgi:hypothetical protein
MCNPGARGGFVIDSTQRIAEADLSTLVTDMPAALRAGPLTPPPIDPPQRAARVWVG